MSRALALGIVLLTAAGCGGPDPKDPSGAPSASAKSASPKRGGKRRNKPAISAEVGALDIEAVKEVYRSAKGAMNACVNKGIESVPYLEGDVELFLRVGEDGRVKWAYPMQTMGDHATDECLLGVLRDKQWPKPEGGREGQTTHSFGVQADARPASPLDMGMLGRAGKKLKKKIDACRKSAGTSKLTVTFYIDSTGKVVAAGAAVGDEKGVDAISCAVDATRKTKFKTPVSYAGKATIKSGG